MNETQPITQIGGMFEAPIPKSMPSSKPKSRSSSMKKESPQGSGKIKGPKNQYLSSNTGTADYKMRSKGASSLMDMKKFKGETEFGSKIQTQGMNFGATGKSNYRDRAFAAADKIQF